MKYSNLVLIGFMGTGKSTVGLALSGKLGWSFVDVDAKIEEKEGRTIPEMFAQNGEAYFRQVETAVIADIMQQNRQIVSMGGGAVLAAGNRARMSSNGLVIALSASVETIIERVRADQNRPLLQGNLEERVASLMEQRKNAYDFADIHINTDNMPVQDIVAAILKAGGWGGE
ncbi:shikimate kinase [Paenibacillus sp. J2TS4]|uniref:shikimate kinase n=1 Tax=Paenibacillus sp. J2TS4 TaxID=2807194 RepID=UPI001B0A89FA|nr:shikimate kinase [Paenibacillus sp. J2TS4]GIP32882.1 shikimate kinase [Paenibacillus sp. J2TS4]